jgi:hypothetical protein
MTMTKEKRRGRTRIEEIELKSVDGLEEIICFVKRRSRSTKRFVIFDLAAKKWFREREIIRDWIPHANQVFAASILVRSLYERKLSNQLIYHITSHLNASISLSPAHIFPFYVVDAW